MTSEDLLNTLDDLGDGEFKKFKWFLQQADVVQGLPTIKKSRLEMTNRWDTVDLMVQTYRLPGAVKVTRKELHGVWVWRMLLGKLQPPSTCRGSGNS
uniref:Pyrin domain-containing protein n=1 Tax=Neolamprologus brichardi TaxID=32507 RepID=A0A3Q4N4V6_NEOBR